MTGHFQSQTRKLNKHYQSLSKKAAAYDSLSYDDFKDTFFGGRYYMMTVQYQGRYYSFPPGLTLPEGSPLTSFNIEERADSKEQYMGNDGCYKYTCSFARAKSFLTKDWTYTDLGTRMWYAYGEGDPDDASVDFLSIGKTDVSQEYQTIHFKDVKMNLMFPVYDFVAYAVPEEVQPIISAIRATAKADAHETSVKIPHGIKALTGSNHSQAHGNGFETGVYFDTTESDYFMKYGYTGGGFSYGISGIPWSSDANTTTNKQLLPRYGGIYTYKHSIYTADTKKIDWVYFWRLKELVFIPDCTIGEVIGS